MSASGVDTVVAHQAHPTIDAGEAGRFVTLPKRSWPMSPRSSRGWAIVSRALAAYASSRSSSANNASAIVPGLSKAPLDPRAEVFVRRSVRESRVHCPDLAAREPTSPTVVANLTTGEVRAPERACGHEGQGGDAIRENTSRMSGRQPDAQQRRVLHYC